MCTINQDFNDLDGDTMKKVITKIVSALLAMGLAVSIYATPCLAASHPPMVSNIDINYHDGKNRVGRWYFIYDDEGNTVMYGKFGDLNDDDRITPVDATFIAQYCLDPWDSYEYCFYMDVNNDGHINAADVTLVLRFCLEYPDNGRYNFF